MKNKITIAIDGPAGAGKTTIGKALAKRLDIMYLSTGSIYRAYGLKCSRMGLDPKDEESARKVIDAKVEVRYLNGAQNVFLDGENITDLIYTEVVGSFASFISQHKIIREKCVELQREIAKNESIVVDGRDIGSVVLPMADYKFYLDADVNERAKRRYKDLAQNKNITYEEVLNDLKERDYQDTNRKLSPLKLCDDAIVVDSTNLSIDEVINKFIEVIEK